MASEGPLIPATWDGSDGSNGGSGFGWTNPSNASAEDGSVASQSISVGQFTYWLKGTAAGFAIPAGATIDGIVVGVKRQHNGSGGAVDKSCKLIKGGTISGNDNKTATAWTGTLTWEDHGSSSDLWGLTWTDSDINASNFGVAFAAENNGSFAGSMEVDAIRITVYYTESGGGGGSATLAWYVA